MAITVEAGISDAQGIASNKRLQILRKVRCSGHQRPIYQNGYHSNLTTERCSDFHPHEIFRIVEPPVAVIVFASEPIISNHRN